MPASPQSPKITILISRPAVQVRQGCQAHLDLTHTFVCQQEEKIAALQSFADQLIAAGHYAKGDISSRRNEVLDRWIFSGADGGVTADLYVGAQARLVWRMFTSAFDFSLSGGDV